MLPVCSAASSCSSPSLIVFTAGAKVTSSVRKFAVDDKTFFGSSVNDCREASFKLQATRSSLSPIKGSFDQAGSPDDSTFSPYPAELDDIVRGFPNKGDEIQYDEFSCSIRQFDGSCSINNDITHLASSTVPEAELSVNDFYIDNITKDLKAENPVAIPEIPHVDLQPVNQPLNDPAYSIPAPDSASDTVSSIILENTSFSSDSTKVTSRSISDLNVNISNVLYDAEQSLDTSISKAKGLIGDTYNSFNTFINKSVKSTSESFDKGIDGLLSSAGNTKEQASDKLAGFSAELKQSIYNTGLLAVDALRKALFSLEDSVSKATNFAAYSYESAKAILPQEVRNSLRTPEEKATIILRPVGAAIQKVYVLIETLERNLGFDPNDPITSFVIFLGGSATLGISYWLLRYGGYSGDLSPQLTLELLRKERSAVLIDVRPEDEREKEGIPDLRRGARFKYETVTLPEVGASAKKQLRNVKHIDGALLAVVIRNLRIVNNGSKVIVMDAKGDRSKEIARSLRRLGVKHPYLVEGGFRSWVKDGLRVKELKPKTTLTVLNEAMYDIGLEKNMDEEMNVTLSHEIWNLVPSLCAVIVVDLLKVHTVKYLRDELKEAEAILEEIRPTPALVLGSGLGLLAATYALAEWEKTLQLIGFIGLGQSLYRRVASYESSEDLKEDLRLLLTPIRLGAQALSLVAGNSETNKIGLPTSPFSTAIQDRVLQAAAKHESQPSDSNENTNGPLESSLQAGGEGLDLSEA